MEGPAQGLPGQIKAGQLAGGQLPLHHRGIEERDPQVFHHKGLDGGKVADLHHAGKAAQGTVVLPQGGLQNGPSTRPRLPDQEALAQDLR